MQREVRVGKVTHAERVDDCIEGVGLERKRFCISLLDRTVGYVLRAIRTWAAEKSIPIGSAPRRAAAPAT